MEGRGERQRDRACIDRSFITKKRAMASCSSKSKDSLEMLITRSSPTNPQILCIVNILLLLLLCCASTAATRTGKSFPEDYYYYNYHGGEGFYFSSRNGNMDKDNINFSSPWASFLNYSGCHFGESQQGLRQVKQYLADFGYLPFSSSFSDSFDDPFRSGILAYQKFFHLNATGELDPSTLEHMVQPRCGIADIINSSYPSLHDGRNLYAFFPGTPTWPSGKSSLTYGLVNASAGSIDEAVLKTVFSRAFGRWEEVTTLTFSEVDPTLQQPDITIAFYDGDHGDGEPFDGQLGTLAHAFSPTDGRFHLDATETWVASAKDEASADLLQLVAAVDLESVAVHEIGHLLGLGHSEVEEAIMYPTIKTRTRRVRLANDDISGIQQLYGSNPKYNGTSNYNNEGTTNPMTEGGVRSSPSASASPPISLAFFLSALPLLQFL